VFLHWQKDLFCAMFSHRNATLAFMGDSLTFEHWSSLIMLLGMPHDPKEQLQSYVGKKNIIRFACNSTLKLVFRRDDYLQSLESVLNETEPDILVINRGAHYVPDELLQTQFNKTIGHLREWQDSSSKPRKLLYRTTAPGHPDCANYTEPSSSLEEMEALVSFSNSKDWYLAVEKRKKFHFWDFNHQNKLILDALATSGLDYQVIDAYKPNIMRPDQHRVPMESRDCLHSCYPGKMDLYNQLMLHILLSWESFED
jgi:hypothetical protein